MSLSLAEGNNPLAEERAGAHFMGAVVLQQHPTASVAWNTIYIANATAHMQHTGTTIEDRTIARLSLAGHNHINFYGRLRLHQPRTATHRDIPTTTRQPQP